MARAKRCLGVDLGSQSVKIVEMGLDKDGPRILRLVSAPVPIGPDASDSERGAAIVSTVRDLIKTHKITTKNSVFGIPARNVVLRHDVRLPRAPGPRLHQIIQFECRNLIPMSLDQSMVEYQVFDVEDPNEVQVLLVVMKKERNIDFMRLVRRMGLRPVSISISSLALYNGHQIQRFNEKQWDEILAPHRTGFLGFPSMGGASKKPRNPKKGKKAEAVERAASGPDLASEAAATIQDEDIALSDDLGGDSGLGFEEVRAYVNVGAFTTDLAVCRSGPVEALGFSRSIPWGGNHVTQAILKECGCDSYTQAERIKIEKTAVQSGLFELEADLSRYDDKACAAATTVCDRIITEIRRSLDYYISQPDGVAVDSIVLSGGGALLPYLGSYLEERLSLPVEMARELIGDQIKCPSQYQEGFDFSAYKVSIGLAAQGLGISPIKIDFLPSDVRAMRDFSAQYGEFVAMAAIIAGTVFFGSQTGATIMKSLGDGVGTYQAFIDRNEPMKELKNEAEAARSGAKDKLAAIAKQNYPRDFWLRFLLRIQANKPPDVLLRSVTCQPNYENPVEAEITIDGETEKQVGATHFIRNLERESRLADSYVKGVTAPYIAVVPSYSDLFKKDVYRFQLTVRAQEERGQRVVTRVMPELTPTPSASGGLGVDGMGDLTPEQLMEMGIMF